jgi:hypothetical protein
LFIIFFQITKEFNGEKWGRYFERNLKEAGGDLYEIKDNREYTIPLSEVVRSLQDPDMKVIKKGRRQSEFYRFKD